MESAASPKKLSPSPGTQLAFLQQTLADGFIAVCTSYGQKLVNLDNFIELRFFKENSYGCVTIICKTNVGDTNGCVAKGNSDLTLCVAFFSHISSRIGIKIRLYAKISFQDTPKVGAWRKIR